MPILVGGSLRIVCVKQSSPVFLAPGAGFMEDNFPWIRLGGGWFRW